MRSREEAMLTNERRAPAPRDGGGDERASPPGRSGAGKRRLNEETLRRIEQAAGRVATQSVARMDDELPWFRALPADQRSWVMLVAQAGIASFVEWLRSPDDVLRLTGEVFGTAPRAMARTGDAAADGRTRAGDHRRRGRTAAVARRRR